MYRPVVECDSGCSAEGSVDGNKESSNESNDATDKQMNGGYSILPLHA